ncbi:uncharacterized protein LOC62_06G008045 [Vanrija pseudolonga]|uniref:Uncharacterized protein n=1 Tax=Vanrija pseudolonga TaxID=143232 RepID=A0AAF0YD50_9TREE|nr:hypothetical protein LOC62_06G008045 [Vanrija pseudolonga]
MTPVPKHPTITFPMLTISKVPPNHPSLVAGTVVGVLEPWVEATLHNTPVTFLEHTSLLAAIKARLEAIRANLDAIAVGFSAALEQIKADTEAYNAEVARFNALSPANTALVDATQGVTSNLTHTANYLTDPVVLLSLALAFDNMGSRAARQQLQALVEMMGPRALHEAVKELEMNTLVQASAEQLEMMCRYF